MKHYDLSIIIPALREEFLANTVADIVKNKRGATEVIVVMDGEWNHPGLDDHEDVRIIKLGSNVGQRAATNIGVRMSRAKYVAKCDAHVAFDEGFDTKLMAHMQDDYTMVPVMRNLHVFNWRCMDCGDESYQGPEPEGCKNCDVNTPDRFEKVIKWHAKPSPQSSAYRFTPDRLQFKYFSELKRRQSGEIAETMSLQGSFFMLTREKYWELDICDESFGGWGQQGTEVALKTWLSGGRVIVNLTTWYAHMFRTQSGFAFPWGNPHKQQEQARQKSLQLFFHNTWDKQVRGLSWVLEHFWEELQAEQYQPDKGDRPWTQADLDTIKLTEGRFSGQPTRGIIYYTDNRLNLKLAHHVQRSIRAAKLPIVSASRKHMDNMGLNIRLRGEPSPLMMHKQILAALEASTADVIFFCEHDVMYHPSHFDFMPAEKDTFYYNRNWWKIWPDGSVARWEANQVSGLVCYRQHALEFYRRRVAEMKIEAFNRSYEPGGRDPALYEVHMSALPNIDVRHGANLTRSHRKATDAKDKSTVQNWQQSDIDHIPGWSAEQLKVLM